MVSHAIQSGREMLNRVREERRFPIPLPLHYAAQLLGVVLPLQEQDALFALPPSDLWEKYRQPMALVRFFIFCFVRHRDRTYRVQSQSIVHQTVQSAIEAACFRWTLLQHLRTWSDHSQPTTLIQWIQNKPQSAIVDMLVHVLFCLRELETREESTALFVNALMTGLVWVRSVTDRLDTT